MRSLEAERLEHQQALDNVVKENDEEMERLTKDIKSLKAELEKVKEKLQRGIEENEILCAKLREVKASPASTPSMHRRYSKRSLSRVDSLSDLASSTSLEDADQVATWDRDRYAADKFTQVCCFYKPKKNQFSTKNSEHKNKK